MARSRSEQQRSEQQPRPSKLTVAQILKSNAASYVAAYPKQAVPQVQSTLAKLSVCRTAALGGHEYRCEKCAHVVTVYNSCCDRYCPTCSGARRSNWLESSQQLILDGVDHFQVVFTLPSELSRLALGNRKAVYDLLFASAWRALKQTIETEHHFQAAALMVLHTWNQKLDAHAHLHAVVPGCGIAVDGVGVQFAQRDNDSDSRGRYLVDADQLRAAYRTAFIRGLKRLHRQNQLKLDGEFKALRRESAWKSFIESLQTSDWVSFIQPPPRPNQSAEHVLKYLTRYLSGGPISDTRIVSTDGQQVTFMARPGETTGGDAKQVPVTLTQLEFTRRWSLHILPSGYVRTRRFGAWNNNRREAYLERLAIQLESTEVPISPQSLEFEPANWEDTGSESDLDQPACPRCGQKSGLLPHRIIAKPTWAKVMASPHRPPWYRLL